MRKKLFAILMSAMMMVTFMPAMAFAATPTPETWTEVEHVEAHKDLSKAYVLENVVWAADYSSATANLVCGYKDSSTKKYCAHVYKSLTATVVREFDSNTGIITATATFDEPGIEISSPTTTARYIDLTGAKLVGKNNAEVTDLAADVYLKNVNPATEKSPATFNYFGAGLGSSIALAKPAYVKDYTTPAYAYQKIWNNETFEFAMAPAANYEAYVDGSYELPVTVTKKAGSEVDVIGTMANKAVTITLAPKSFGNVSLAMDGTVVKAKLDNDNNLSDVAYDGEEHTFSIATKGLAVKWNANINAEPTSEGWTTEPIKIKDAKTTRFAVMVTKENAVAPSFSKIFKVSVKVSKKVLSAKLVQAEMTVPYGEVKTMADLLKVEGVATADEAVMADVIAKKYTIDGFFTELGSNTLKVKEVVTPALTDAEKAVAGNYTFPEKKTMEALTMKLTIEKATFNKVTLKAQTVKKNKTIKATAKVGKVNFKKVSGNKKIKVSKAGKVTVKKGLKKGTYKVKVKAYVSATNNFVGASTTKTIKVKVK